MLSQLFPTWKTVTLGAYSDIAGYEKALKARGVRLVGHLDDIPLAKEKTEVELVLFNGFGMLGNLVPKIHARNYYATANTFGLEACPQETALALALCVEPQEMPAPEVLLGTPPLKTTRGNPYLAQHAEDETLLYLSHEGPVEREGNGIRLSTITNQGIWSIEVTWVFARRRT